MLYLNTRIRTYLMRDEKYIKYNIRRYIGNFEQTTVQQYSDHFDQKFYTITGAIPYVVDIPCIRPDFGDAIYTVTQ